MEIKEELKEKAWEQVFQATYGKNSFFKTFFVCKKLRSKHGQFSSSELCFRKEKGAQHPF